jgi:hypothetical protein
MKGKTYFKLGAILMPIADYTSPVLTTSPNYLDLSAVGYHAETEMADAGDLWENNPWIDLGGEG